jgi:hypothetical protein
VTALTTKEKCSPTQFDNGEGENPIVRPSAKDAWSLVSVGFSGILLVFSVCFVWFQVNIF